MTRITRSTGIPVGAGAVVYGMAGGGYQGLTPELDNVVQEGAKALAEAYGMDVTIRFNSDRASGGAWLVTHARDDIGANGEVGIGGGVVTARMRASWERFAAQAAEWEQKDDDPAVFTNERQHYETALRESPEGQLTIYAHISSTSTLPGKRAELAKLPGWNDMSGRPSAYHHGPADSVAQALERCLYFAPTAALLRVGV
jgi:hypothetical protein